MKKRRKTERCLNCDYPLKPSFNFCPECGQENTSRQISFGRLLKDFFSNYFSLDSRFGKSIKPFFLKPGFLTREFMEGKRVAYANPIRLYLVISLIHFFVLSIFTSSGIENNPNKNQGIIDISAPDPDLHADSTTTGSAWPISEKDFRIIQEMTAEDFTAKEIEDSLQVDQRSFIKRHITRQIIKIVQSDQSSISAYIIKNIPILMFLLLPVYALLLKLFFRKKLYINHLVHSLHIHSFVFIILTLYWLAAIILPYLPDRLNIFVFILLTFYIVVSFKNTYNTSKWTAFYKVFLSGSVYIILMFFSLILEMIISLLTY